MPRRSDETNLEDSKREILLSLERHGWFVIKVAAGDGEPAFAYSLGLFESFGQPEIVVFGLDLETMHILINDVGDLMRNGEVFVPGSRSDRLLEGYFCEFKSVVKSQSYAQLTYSSWYYGHDDFPVLQLVWPDIGGKLPWEDGFDERFRADQPDLSA